MASWEKRRQGGRKEGASTGKSGNSLASFIFYSKKEFFMIWRNKKLVAKLRLLLDPGSQGTVTVNRVVETESHFASLLKLIMSGDWCQVFYSVHLAEFIILPFLTTLVFCLFTFVPILRLPRREIKIISLLIYHSIITGNTVILEKKSKPTQIKRD